MNTQSTKLCARPILLRVICIGSFFLFFVSLVGYMAIQLLVHSLLDSGLYTNVLAQNRVYDRIYEDVLADPEIQNRVNDLLAKFDINVTTAELISSYTVSTLRLALPPEQLKRAGDSVIIAITDYLKGRHNRINSTIQFNSILTDELVQRRLITDLQTYIAEQAFTADLFADTLIAMRRLSDLREAEDFDKTLAELHAFANGVARGKPEDIPISVFTLHIDQLTDEQEDAIINTLFSPLGDAARPATIAQVRAALHENDISTAIILASRDLSAPTIQRILNDTLNQLDEGTIDLLILYAGILEHSQQDVLTRINNMRVTVQLLQQRIEPLAILGMVLSLVALTLMNGLTFRQKIQGIGLVLILSGLLILAVWIVLMVRIGSNIGLEQELSQIPETLHTLLLDILSGILSEIRLSVFMRAMYPLLLGIVLIALSYGQHLGRIINYAELTLERKPQFAFGSILILTLLPIIVDVLNHHNGPAIPRCNGLADLCERQLHEVTFAGTHNAMSVSDQGWIFATHDGSLTDQLNAGIRALLIDAHYFDTREEWERLAIDAPVEVQMVIQDVINELGLDFDMQREGIWLCHDLCLLGSTPLIKALTEIRQFIEAHPNEVIILVFQDAVSNDDIIAAFTQSELINFVYRGVLNEDIPTLAELIAINQRVIVMAEESGPPPEWYHHMWSFTEETPFVTRSIEDFTCEPNRGGTGKPFFLLNHWITKTSPSRVDAIRVNNFDFLLERVQACASERNQIPNIIAVNFYNLGDLVAVVNAINANALD